VFPHCRYYPTITTKSDHHFQEKIPSSRSMLTLKGLSLSISCSMGSFLYAYCEEIRRKGCISALQSSLGREICCQRLKFVSLSRRRILTYLTLFVPTAVEYMQLFGLCQESCRLSLFHVIDVEFCRWCSWTCESNFQ